MYILNIETSTKNCSVSIGYEEKVIDVLEYAGENYSHAEKLHIFIRDILKRNQLKPSDLTAVSVSKGPGSYTGLRIGVSAAKGLAYALDIPLIAVPTLHSLAKKVKPGSPAFIIPLIDARRMEVYSAVYNQNHELIRQVKAEILEDNIFNHYLDKQKVYFVGDAVEKTKTLINHKNAIFLDEKFPSAKEMHVLSYQKLLKKEFEDVAYFEPFYLKDFIITTKK